MTLLSLFRLNNSSINLRYFVKDVHSYSYLIPFSQFVYLDRQVLDAIILPLTINKDNSRFLYGSISLAASLLLQLFPLQLSQSHHTSSQYKLFSIHVVINRLGVCKGWKRCPPWNTYNKLVFSIQIRRLGNNLCIIIPLEK